MKHFKSVVKGLFLTGIILLFYSGKIIKNKAEDIIISPTHVLSKDSTALREKVYNWSVKTLNMPAEQMEAHPSAKSFPGKVDEDAKRISKTIHLAHTPPEEELVSVIQTLRYSQSISQYHIFYRNVCSTWRSGYH